jgi:hypothetical protein
MRSDEDSPVRLQLYSIPRGAFGHPVQRERVAGCNRRRISPTFDAGRDRFRRRSGRDTRAEGFR